MYKERSCAASCQARARDGYRGYRGHLFRSELSPTMSSDRGIRTRAPAPCGKPPSERWWCPGYVTECWLFFLIRVLFFIFEEMLGWLQEVLWCSHIFLHSLIFWIENALHPLYIIFSSKFDNFIHFGKDFGIDLAFSSIFWVFLF